MVKKTQPKWRRVVPTRSGLGGQYEAWTIKIGPLEIDLRRTSAGPTIWEARSTGRSVDVFHAGNLVQAKRAAINAARRRVQQEKRVLSAQYDALIDYEAAAEATR